MANQTTLQNPTFGKIKTAETATSTTAQEVAVIELDGTNAKMIPDKLPIIQGVTNYSPTTATIEGHLKGLDLKIGQIGQTTAGTTNRIYFTGEGDVNFFFTSTNKGSVATASRNVINDDNQKKFFGTDLISPPQAVASTSPPGIYSGQLTVSKNANGDKDRFTIEAYKTDNLGVAIPSGITNASIGSLGVTVIAILDSGEINIPANSQTNITVSGILSSTLTLNVGERVRYHVSAAKVGTGGGLVTYNVFYGSNHNSFIDVPVQANTDGVLNKSNVLGATTTDALNNLNAKSLTIESGTYVPTFINIINCSDFSIFNCRFVKTGSVIRVSLSLDLNQIDVTPKTSAFDFSLPFTPDYGSLVGIGVANDNNNKGIAGVVQNSDTGTPSLGRFVFTPTFAITKAVRVYLTFDYNVI